ncbi:MAG: UbiA family prenyltransferase [Methanotrichaceae archaeon]|nr:UbiA family prenyltransferase [Methanotrichaceae archaeon]
MVFSIYSLDKLSDGKEDLTNMPERAEFLKRKSRFIYSCSIVAYLLAGLLILIVKPIGLPIIFLPIASNAVYGSKPLPGIPRLKEVPFMKNILVAFIWALVTVLLPGIQNATFSVIAFIFYFIFIKCFINTVIYDIRDIDGDRRCGIKTIPILLGNRYTIAVLIMINTTLLLWLILTNVPHRFLYGLMILYGYFYIIRFSEADNYFCLDILVDGEWIIFSLALVLLNNFSSFG